MTYDVTHAFRLIMKMMLICGEILICVEILICHESWRPVIKHVDVVSRIL